MAISSNTKLENALCNYEEVFMTLLANHRFGPQV